MPNWVQRYSEGWKQETEAGRACHRLTEQDWEAQGWLDHKEPLRGPGPSSWAWQAGREDQLWGAVMIILGTSGAPRPTCPSACACETGCRGSAACSWHPCSRCLRVGGEQGSGQTQEGETNRPSLPWTEGFPGTPTLRAKPGRTPGKAGQLVKQALSSRTHHRALPMPPPRHPLGGPATQHLLQALALWTVHPQGPWSPISSP